MDKESFREIHSKATNETEDVMKRFYGILSNGNAPVFVNYAKVIENKITKNLDFIFISPAQVDDEQMRKLIAELKDSGYSYFPVYEKCEEEYIPSFYIIKKGASKNELASFVAKICQRFMVEVNGAKIKTWNYVNPMPCQLAERQRRKGEIMVWKI